MSLYSTRNRATRATWREAVLSGIAPDGGLYLPIELPRYTPDALAAVRDASFVELASHLAHSYIGLEVPKVTLETICREAFNFPITLRQLTPTLSVLELFHGPTCAFKDFGARFMARLFRHFWGTQDKQLTVLVATSGDTGSAVANAFLDTQPNPPIRVAILYPKGKVSDVQRKQMTTLGHNVTAYEVAGTFDDCQALAKQALRDSELLQQVPLTSANSINIARLLPQMFYYAYTTLRFPAATPPLFCIPSGNLGNLTGSVLAHLTGFRASHIIAACNSNRTFPQFLASGTFAPTPSIETTSNAMDVGDPSNFYRIIELLPETAPPDFRLHDLISAYSISDDETKRAIRSYYDEHSYILDPHTAVGACALMHHASCAPSAQHSQVLVATAHPAKFSRVVHEVLGREPELPKALAEVLGKAEHPVSLSKSYRELHDVLRSQR